MNRETPKDVILRLMGRKRTPFVPVGVVLHQIREAASSGQS